ncbi:MAG: TraB/GumN family protein [Cryomorphaceae bacterium]|nr:TraB/GumN family protein [Cryomorphaceae bacterium]
MIHNFFKQVTILLLLVLASESAFAQGLLYKVEGNGLKQPSFIFGTMHMICAEDFVMPDELPQALQATKLLYLEMDITDTTMQQTMMSKLIDPAMEENYTMLSQETTEIIDQILVNALNIEFKQLKIMKPIIVSMMLVQASFPCSDIKSFETALVDMAKEQGIPIKALETLDFQLGLFDEVSIEDQLKMLESMAMNHHNAAAEYRMLTDAYTSGNIDKILQITKKDPTFSGFDDLILGDRNEEWLKKLPAIMKQSPSFIAVGAAHLPGDKGILEGLKKMGYKVKPL